MARTESTRGHRRQHLDVRDRVEAKARRMVASTKRALDHYDRLPEGTWTLRELQRTGTTTLANGVVLDLAALCRRVVGLE